jgi:hypothetical protein
MFILGLIQEQFKEKLAIVYGKKRDWPNVTDFSIELQNMLKQLKIIQNKECQ